MSLDSCHPISQRGEIGDNRLGIAGHDQSHNHVPDGDHILNLHTKERPDTIAGKICKKIPVIRKIRYHEPGGDQPDSRLDDTDTGSKVGVAFTDVNCADCLQGCLEDPCYKDNNWNREQNCKDTRIDNRSLPVT